MGMSIPSPTTENKKDAVRFVKLLAGSFETPVTWQVFDDAPDKDYRKAAIIHGSIKDVGKRLLASNINRCGVFLTIAETDLTGRKRQNIRRVRALFVDCDTVRPDMWHLEPSMVVESIGGPHAYWLVDDCSLEAFSDCQKRLAAHYGSDPRVHDLPRVMRVPGFWHSKKEHQMVSISSMSCVRYKVSEVMYGIPEFEKPQPVPVYESSIRHQKATAGRGPIDWRAINLLSVFSDAGLYGRELGSGKHSVVCPWTNEHSHQDYAGTNGSTVIWERGTSGAPIFFCAHVHCTGRKVYDVMMKLQAPLPRCANV